MFSPVDGCVAAEQIGVVVGRPFDGAMCTSAERTDRERRGLCTQAAKGPVGDGNNGTEVAKAQNMVTRSKRVENDTVGGRGAAITTKLDDSAAGLGRTANDRGRNKKQAMGCFYSASDGRRSIAFSGLRAS